MPFVEVVGSAGTVPPAHMVDEVPKSNAGVMFGLTVTLKVATVAHCPASGVKVYVADAWLSTIAGFQTPVIPLSEVAGKEGTAPPLQMTSEVPKLNVGGIFGLTVTVNVVVVAHCPDVGVKV